MNTHLSDSEKENLYSTLKTTFIARIQTGGSRFIVTTHGLYHIDQVGQNVSALRDIRDIHDRTIIEKYHDGVKSTQGKIRQNVSDIDKRFIHNYHSGLYQHFNEDSVTMEPFSPSIQTDQSYDPIETMYLKDSDYNIYIGWYYDGICYWREKIIDFDKILELKTDNQEMYEYILAHLPENISTYIRRKVIPYTIGYTVGKKVQNIAQYW